MKFLFYPYFFHLWDELYTFVPFNHTPLRTLTRALGTDTFCFSCFLGSLRPGFLPPSHPSLIPTSLPSLLLCPLFSPFLAPFLASCCPRSLPHYLLSSCIQWVCVKLTIQQTPCCMAGVIREMKRTHNPCSQETQVQLDRYQHKQLKRCSINTMSKEFAFFLL